MSEQTILIVDDDENIGWALATGLEEPGRQIIVCRDVESADFVLDESTVTHVLTDIKFGGAFGFEGLQVIDRVKQKVQTATVIAMSGHATDELRREAKARGAAALLKKPFSFDEIEALIPPAVSREKGSLTFIPTIDQIITGSILHSVFQPIVWIDNQEQPVGFEALSRLPGESALSNPESLFRYAMAKHRVVDLEIKAVHTAIETGRKLTELGFLSLNIHPELFSVPDLLCDELFSAAEDADVPLQRIVVEITEQGQLPALSSVDAVASVLRAHGVRLGFDDIGIGHSHLRAMAAVRPAYLKISQHFGTSCENNPTNRKIIENLEGLARSFSAEVVLEGIETMATASFAKSMGIRFGQGYFYGAPSEVADLLSRYR
jgi:EAL domain-containing protein (putative c-di-GMP-specific phosphodiesterase class I)